MDIPATVQVSPVYSPNVAERPLSTHGDQSKVGIWQTVIPSLSIQRLTATGISVTTNLQISTIQNRS